MLVVGPGLASVPSRVQMIRFSAIRSSLLKVSSDVSDSSGLRRYGGGAGGGGVGVVNSVGGPASSGAGSRCLHVFGRFRRHHQQLRHLSKPYSVSVPSSLYHTPISLNKRIRATKYNSRVSLHRFYLKSIQSYF